MARFGIWPNSWRARSGRAQSTRFARARTEPPRRTAALAASRPWPLLACRATPCPRPLARTLQATPGALQRRRQGSLGGTPASAVGSCHGRRRPSHPRAPAAPWNHPSSSTSSSACARRRHVALQLQSDGRRRSYPRPPRDQQLFIKNNNCC